MNDRDPEVSIPSQCYCGVLLSDCYFNYKGVNYIFLFHSDFTLKTLILILKKSNNSVKNYCITFIKGKMVQIQAQGKTITCEPGANLRKVLLENGVDLYNGQASLINCHGLGTCGTCCVEIEGEVSEPQGKEKIRLALPPHSSKNQRRLACQVKVLGDIKVKKYDGFWGQGSQTAWTP